MASRSRICSDMPSAKYSWSCASLISTNGSTAMDLSILVPTGRPAGAGCAPDRRCRPATVAHQHQRTHSEPRSARRPARAGQVVRRPARADARAPWRVWRMPPRARPAATSTHWDSLRKYSKGRGQRGLIERTAMIGFFFEEARSSSLPTCEDRSSAFDSSSTAPALVDGAHDGVGVLGAGRYVPGGEPAGDAMLFQYSVSASAAGAIGRGVLTKAEAPPGGFGHAAGRAQHRSRGIRGLFPG